VVWDNLSAHQGADVAEALAAAGITQHYLPPYSPDYNPIEQAWSKIKTQLRAAGAHTHRACAVPSSRPYRRSPKAMPQLGFELALRIRIPSMNVSRRRGCGKVERDLGFPSFP
jgi:transposase InsO family protein